LSSAEKPRIRRPSLALSTARSIPETGEPSRACARQVTHPLRAKAESDAHPRRNELHLLRQGPAGAVSVGCCDGLLSLCLLADDLAPGPGDLMLGEVAGSRSTSTPSSTSGGASPRSCSTRVRWARGPVPHPAGRAPCRGDPLVSNPITGRHAEIRLERPATRRCWWAAGARSPRSTRCLGIQAVCHGAGWYARRSWARPSSGAGSTGRGTSGIIAGDGLPAPRLSAVRDRSDMVRGWVRPAAAWARGAPGGLPRQRSAYSQLGAQSSTMSLLQTAELQKCSPRPSATFARRPAPCSRPTTSAPTGSIGGQYRVGSP
jgi:hypothetical protein